MPFISLHFPIARLLPPITLYPHTPPGGPITHPPQPPNLKAKTYNAPDHATCIASLRDGRIAVGCSRCPSFWLWDWKCTVPARTGSSASTKLHRIASLRDGQLLVQYSHNVSYRDVPTSQVPEYLYCGVSHLSAEDGAHYALGQPGPGTSSGRQRDILEDANFLFGSSSRGEAFSVADDGQTYATINSRAGLIVYREGLPDTVIYSSPESVADYWKWRDGQKQEMLSFGPPLSIPPLMAIVGDRIVVQHGSYVAVFEA